MPDQENPTQPTGPTQPEPSGRDRLRDALRPHFSRGKIIVAVLLAIVGFLAILQVRAENDENAEFAGARREELLQLLDSLDAAAARARSEVNDLEERRQDLRSDTNRREAAREEAQEEVQTLGILAGTLPAAGPGVEITINDPKRAIGSSTLLSAFEELRDAGAEAIEVNNKLRIVAQSSMIDVEGDGELTHIQIDGVEIRPPYVIEAIGDPHTLSTAMDIPGGVRDEVEQLQGTIEITSYTDEELEIGSLYSTPEPQYATPSDETDE